MTATRIPPRERLVEAALRLFHRDGFHATGIDRVLAEAGVAKMTLYNHFKSKEALALAALRLRDLRFRAWLDETTGNRAAAARNDGPVGRLLALVDALEEWFADPAFHGCLFINAAAEYGDVEDPIHRAAAEHKAEIVRWLTGLAEGAGAVEPEALATALALIKDGLIVQARIAGHEAPATRRAVEVARRVAAELIRKG